MPPEQQVPNYEGVRSGSRAYSAMAKVWKKMRDVIDGQEAVHAAGVTYLPKLIGQEDPEYQAYKQRALFFTAAGRTLDGLTGLLFARPIKVEAPGAEDLTNDVTLQGDKIQAFAENVAREIMAVGGCGVLVDYPTTGDRVLTLSQEQRANIRPFARTYCPENILDFRCAQINNVSVLQQVRLLETVEVPGKDEFTTETIEQVRVLELVSADLAPTPGAGPGAAYYRQRVFRKDAAGKWALLLIVTPTKGGAPLDFIPFQFFGPRDNSPKITKPPLLDVANLNLHHYLTSADYHHGLHFTGLPTPWFAGFGVDGKDPIRVGSETALCAENADATCGYLEFTGQGLQETREALKHIEGQLAALGARMLAPEKLGVEAADALEIRNRGEQSVMSAISVTTSHGLTQVLRWMIEWRGGDASKVLVELNRDFLPTGASAQNVTALVGAYQAGTLLLRDLIRFLQRADLADPQTSIEDYLAALQTQQPPGGMDIDNGGAGAGDGGDQGAGGSTGAAG